ncbi:MAG: c-type cytochrome domain-containing protein [Verrucomicrobiales bacterium]
MLLKRCLAATSLIGLLSLFSRAEEAKSDDPSKPVSYWRQIRTIFQANCTGCHQPAKAKGELIMTDFAALIKGGADAGPGIVPGKPDESSVVKNITPGPDGKAEMPKKADPLRPQEISLIRQWIQEGGVDDTPAHARQVWDAEHPPVYAHAPLVTAIDFSPDGQLLAVSGFHETLLVRADNGALIGRLIGLSERIESVSFSPDGRRLAVAGGQPGRMGEVQVWDVAEKKLVLSQPVTFDTVYGASWSPDGKNVAFGGADKSVRAIEADTGKQTFFVLTHEDWVQDTAWSVKGDQVFSAGRDMTAKLSDFATQRFIDNITSITPGALRGGLQALSRHPERDEILVGGSDGEPRLYRTNREVERKIGDDSNLIRKFPPIEGRIWAADFAPDGKSFAVGGTRTDENATGSLIKGIVAFYGCDVDSKLPEDLKAILRKESFSRNADEKAKVEAYLTQGVALLKKIELPTGVYAVTYQPDGSFLACAGADGLVRLLKPGDGTIAMELQPFPLSTVQTAAK